jgi:monoamine oxidase
MDTAIVGGGCAGAYSAWRLAQSLGPKEDPRSIHLFEMSERVGGRLMSVNFPGMPHVKTELGGMRVMSRQKIVLGVMEQMGIDTVGFPMGTSSNLAYIRRRRIAQSDFTNPEVLPYNLPPWERHMEPSQLMREAIDRIVPGIMGKKTQKARQEACDKAEIDGIPLRDYGFWPLLLDQLSSEGYELAVVGGGYNTLLRNWNAANAIPWYLADFAPGKETVKYTTPAKGMESITTELVREFRHLGGRLSKDFELVSFGRNDDGLIDLVFLDHRRGTQVRRLAKKLVLALPQHAILKLAQHAPDRPSPIDFFRSDYVMQLLHTVSPRKLYKFALAYDTPWWHLLGLESGRSLTDLPLRQVYYFLTEGDQRGANKANRNSYIDCSYTDGVSVDYWEGVHATGKPYRGQDNPWLKPGEKPVIAGLEASDQMVKRATEQLQEVHGLVNLPRPYSAMFKDWNDAPYGGGWHTWNIGVDTRSVMPAVRHPRSEYPVYVCGESWSESQGWVEGAFQTAERMLQEHFGLEWPEWLDRDYFLGH